MKNRKPAPVQPDYCDKTGLVGSSASCSPMQPGSSGSQWVTDPLSPSNSLYYKELQKWVTKSGRGEWQDTYKEETMSGCGRRCNTSELLPGFVESLRGQIEERLLKAPVKRLCEHAESLKKLFCEITLEEMQHHFCYLYSLEDDSYTAQDSEQEIYILRLFYDYLAGRGCVAVNPVKALKEAARAQLLARLEEHGYRREEIGGEDGKGA
jgi:hypothetical protein